MGLQVYTLEQDRQWDAIVRSFEKYEVYYLSDYVRAFQLHGDGEPLLFYYSDENCRGINAVMKRDIGLDEHFKGKLPEATYFDLSTPYGYGGFIFEGSASEAVYDAYEDYCKENKFVSEFVRFGLFNGYQRFYKGEVECRIRNVVRNLELPIDEMLADFEHKVRKNIRKAVKNGLEIMVEQSDIRLEDFLRIYYATMDRNDAEKQFYFSREFFEILNRMRDNTVYFYVRHKGEVIAAELIIYGAENAYSYLGGTDSTYFDLRPNDFLKFEAIKWLKEKGLKNFVLGGGYGSDDGIFRYKKSFSPNNIMNFYTGRNIFNKDVYEELVQMREGKDFNKESSYFPLYRAE